MFGMLKSLVENCFYGPQADIRFRSSLLALGFIFIISSQPAIARNVSPQELAVISKKVSRDFKDPDSAKYTNVRIDPKQEIVCGEVNAKNAYGGYVGATVFFGVPVMKGNSMVDFKLRAIYDSELENARLRYELQSGNSNATLDSQGVFATCRKAFPDAEYRPRL